MLNKQLLLTNSNAKEDYVPFYIDFGNSGGSVEISYAVNPSFYISSNGIDWRDQTYGGSDILQVPSGRIYFKAVEPTDSLFGSVSSVNKWIILGTNVKLGGNINSLLSADNPSSVQVSNYAFASMFVSCTAITDASELILPAKTIDYATYRSMFYKCSNLIRSPIICAETIGEGACELMFHICTSLISITCLATQVQEGACTSWAYDVSPGGTFYKNTAMSTWSVGTSGIPAGWDIVDYN